MFGLGKSQKLSIKLDPIPLGIVPSVISEGCGTGRAYVIYVTTDHKMGMIVFNHCASISCLLEKGSGYASGFVHDLHHSSEWRSLSPGRSVDLCLSAPNATTWGDIHHYKIPFGRSIVNVFAADFEVRRLDCLSVPEAVEHCMADLRAHHRELEELASVITEAYGD
ncbi:hypothetical protein [Verrucomicrobium sp. BvORR106]|uniref:hypothetical protein n=1 Tax=Verrucomicrobium sp. BvORR106 TaxID=1403819 RepID=UPI000571854D|nr:hypothetical protein [Verrucomicrobium sp. BvORR106]